MALVSNGNPDAGSVTTNVFSIEDLFYMPLKAVIDANTQASLSAVNIIKKYGFENDTTSPNYGKLKMVEFSYDYAGKNGILTTTSVSIPFITLIPLPLLEVKHATVEIAAQILAKMDLDVQQVEGAVKKSKVLTVLSPVKNVSAAQASIEANINISVQVAQSDLPAGMLKLINFGQEAVIGGQLINLSITPAARLLFKPGGTGSIAVSFEDLSSLPPNIIFTVSVQPGILMTEGAFVKPIQIEKGYLVGEASNNSIKVIPEQMDGGRVFVLTFFAGMTPCNGFICVESGYSTKQSIYFNIQTM